MSGHRATRRAYRLGRQAGIDQPDRRANHAVIGLPYPDAGCSITGAEWIDAIKDVIGPTIPKITKIENGIDDRWSIPAGRLSNIDATNMKN